MGEEKKKKGMVEYETKGYTKSQLIETAGTHLCHLMITQNTGSFQYFHIPRICDRTLQGVKGRRQGPESPIPIC